MRLDARPTAGSTEHVQLMAQRQVLDLEGRAGSERPAGRAEQGGKPGHDADILGVDRLLTWNHESRAWPSRVADSKWDLRRFDSASARAGQVPRKQADAVFGTHTLGSWLLSAFMVFQQPVFEAAAARLLSSNEGGTTMRASTVSRILGVLVAQPSGHVTLRC
ncbi:MAG: hypothetical protein V1774_05690, partial [Candidatus Eisenbacteria bacterium]